MRLLVLTIALPLLLGCEGAPRAAPKDALGKPTEVNGESAGADGMCKAHGVLEALCTQCNGALIAVFQAKGDYCSEHGFPESICPNCHPERGGRPAQEVRPAEAEGPADGTKVHFKTTEIAKLAGIETARAMQRSEGGGLRAPARLTYDAARVAQMNPRASGVVRTLHVDIGTKVTKGDVIATLDSAEVGADRSKLRAATTRLNIALSNVEREKRSHAEGIGTAGSVLTAEYELESARAEVQGLTSALSLVGTSNSTTGLYSLRAPINGVVTKRNASIGQLVTIEDALFEIVDPTSLFAEVDIPEMAALDVHLGQEVFLRIDGLGDRDFEGILSYLSPEVDLHTRTVKARALISNHSGLLRANMYGNARIHLDQNGVHVVVPESAVQRAKDVNLVFVRLKEDEFEARRVEIGAREEGQVEIKKGVRPGEQVATVGSFLLKTETLKGSIGAGCCEVD